MSEKWSKKKDTPSYTKKYWSLIHNGPELYTLNHVIDKKIIKVHYIRYADTRAKEIRELRYNKEIEEEIQLWDIELNQWTKIKVM
jgi:hypothetical protein